MRNFSNRERRGVITLALVCVVILALSLLLPKILPQKVSTPLYREILLESAADSTNSSQECNTELSHGVNNKNIHKDSIASTHRKNDTKGSDTKRKKKNKTTTKKQKTPSKERTNPLDRPAGY